MNDGKIFEKAIKDAVPENCLYHRLDDSTGNFSGGSDLRFTATQPCDAFIYNGRGHTLYALEMKTTKNAAFSFENINSDLPEKKMIHKHQIRGLLHFANKIGVIAGFMFNFRKIDGTEVTYFQNIFDFVKMTSELEKKSFNENDLLKYNPYPIVGRKKKIHYSWDLTKFLHDNRYDYREVIPYND